MNIQQEILQSRLLDRLTIPTGKRILVTGASGLLGQWLTQTFVSHSARYGGKNEIWAVVGHDVPANMKHLLDLPFIHFLKLDLSYEWQLLPSVDVIVHAATFAQPARFMAHPITTIQLNAMVTQELFKRLYIGGKFLFISSSEVYSGAPTPYTEDSIGTTTPQHPRSQYIESKRLGETLVHTIRATGQYDAKSARISLVYGPGTRKGDTRVLNEFIEQALTRGEICLQDQGLAQRTYCYALDTTEMLINVLFEGAQEVYNIGGQSETTIRDLAELVAKLTKTEVELPFIDESSPGAPASVKMALNRYIDEFGAPQFINLETGLSRTIDWQQNWLYPSSVDKIA